MIDLQEICYKKVYSQLNLSLAGMVVWTSSEFFNHHFRPVSIWLTCTCFIMGIITTA